VVKFTLDAGYDSTNSFALKDEAKRLMDSDPAKFRDAYGDYFVAAVERGARFVAIYRLTASSKDVLNEFKSSFGAEASEVASAEGAVRFKQETKRRNIRSEIDVTAEGYTGLSPDGAAWTPERVYEALKNFKENATGRPVRVILQHYSHIVPTYPKTIDID